MMKKWIVALAVLLFCASAHAQSYVKDWSSGKRLLESSGIVPRMFLALIALNAI